MTEYIEREAIIKMIVVNSVKHFVNPEASANMIHDIQKLPAADVRPVVLCRDCIFRSNEWTGCPKLNGTITSDEFFCKCGIKKREES